MCLKQRKGLLYTHNAIKVNWENRVLMKNIRRILLGQTKENPSSPTTSFITGVDSLQTSDLTAGYFLFVLPALQRPPSLLQISLGGRFKIVAESDTICPYILHTVVPDGTSTDSPLSYR